MTDLIIFTIFFSSVLVFLKLNYTKKLYFTVIVLFFPMYIKFMGRDAITTSTLFIFFMFFFYLYEQIKTRATLFQKMDLIIYFMILIAGISTAYNYHKGEIFNDLIGNAVRRYIAFSSCMLLIIIIKNYKDLRLNVYFNENYLETLLNIILFLTAFHVLIIIFVQYFPFLESILTVFSARNSDPFVIDSFGEKGRIARISSFVFSYEALGEIIGSMIPIVIYKSFKSRSLLWVLVYIIFSIGVLMTGTRSGILIFIFGTIITTPIFIRYSLSKVYLMINVIIILPLCLFLIKPFFLEDVIARFEIAINMINKSGTLLEVTNRSFLNDVFSYVLQEISILGHGIILPSLKYEWGNLWFHNLYLTIIHQLGIFGSLIFFVILLSPVCCLLLLFISYGTTKKSVAFCCLLSLTLFFINEFKFEFIRYDSYSQIWFGLIAIYYSVGNYFKKMEDL